MRELPEQLRLPLQAAAIADRSNPAKKQLELQTQLLDKSERERYHKKADLRYTTAMAAESL